MPMTKDKIKVKKASGCIEAAKVCFNLIPDSIVSENELHEGLKHLRFATILLRRVAATRELDEIIKKGKIN